jgi:hypothetical protein
LDSSNNTWSSSNTNWSCGHIPYAVDNVVINGGSCTLDVNVTVNAFTLNGGQIGGNYNMNVTNDFIQNGGTITGTGTYTINGEYLTNIPNSNIVTLNVLDKSIIFNGGGTIQNTRLNVRGSTTFTIPDNQTITFHSTIGSMGLYRFNTSSNPTNIVINAGGTLRKTGAQEVRLEACNMTCAGQIRNESGALIWGRYSNASNTYPGDIYIADGSEIIIAGGTHDLSNCEFSGGGQFTSGESGAVLNFYASTFFASNMRIVTWYNTTWNFNNFDATVRSYRITGIVNGTGNLVVTDWLHMDGAPEYNVTGDITCQGDMNIFYGACKMGGSGNLNVLGTLSLILQSGVSVPTILNLYRNAVISGNISSNSSINQLNVQAGKELTLANTAPQTATGSGQLNIYGNLTKSSPNTAYTIQLTTQTYQNSVVNIVEPSGVLAFGNTSVTLSGTIKGNGKISFATPPTNAATFKPGASPGTLTYDGNYANGTLEMEIGYSGGQVEKDLLLINGNMNLSNTALNLVYTGGALPVGVYELVSCTGTRSGTFVGVTYPPVCNGNCSIAYNANNAQLVVTAPLPLELGNFSAKALKQSNEIRWRTLQERQVAWHIVERSAEGAGFWQEIGRTPGALYSAAPKEYQMEDRLPLPQAYYRLRSVDTDGREQVSGLVSVARPQEKLQIMAAYPLPVQDVLEIRFAAITEERIQIALYSVAGVKLFEEMYTAHDGVNTYTISVNELSAGLYSLLLTDEKGNREVLQVVKQ